MGNIHSILKALRLYHDNVVYTADPAELSRASALVLPGDGAFEAAMTNLSGTLGDTLRSHVSAGRPLFGICIGFQVLFEDSDEVNEHAGRAAGHLVKGLGLLPGRIRRFRFPNGDTRVPHMGWNTLVGGEQDQSYMYFIHSYRAEGVPKEYVVSSCDYSGVVFPALVQKDNVYASQFHPEKSSTQGLSLIKRWVDSL
ncbi:MAG: imidazole glycerol phosphate synthase subunit HisH [Spirochaetia bacterium]|nr:imidazole glycerol phosphate synthase subunit HisH [Spirochaetia bacterium]